jgi:hypothetical protein
MTDTLFDYHTNAAALIIAAAEKSGLLKDVAEMLCAFDKGLAHPLHSCPQPVYLAPRGSH